ncbi:MAG: VacJ family lipoprotein [Alphaproteobacteria bacterium]|nr:MAG: VacJ family lipoprotein [Alphaproteobacteria bacterium]
MHEKRQRGASEAFGGGCRHAAGLVAVVTTVLLLAACAGGPKPNAEAAARQKVEDARAPADSIRRIDPYESWNRGVFKANMVLDRYVMRPVAWVYRTVLPDFVERMISNGFANAGMPLVFANTLLQGDLKRSGQALGRFLVNSTLGIAGVADPASEMGIPKVDEDFGQTLAVWGVKEGPYLVLPLLGPSNPRDAVGFAVDAIADPFMIGMDKLDVHNLQLSLSLGNIVEARARHWDDVNTLLEATDPYALARSAYRQRRAYLISNGRPEQTEEEESIFEEDFEEPPPEPEGPSASSSSPDAAARVLADPRGHLLSPRPAGDDALLLPPSAPAGH